MECSPSTALWLGRQLGSCHLSVQSVSDMKRWCIGFDLGGTWHSPQQTTCQLNDQTWGGGWGGILKMRCLINKSNVSLHSSHSLYQTIYPIWITDRLYKGNNFYINGKKSTFFLILVKNLNNSFKIEEHNLLTVDKVQCYISHRSVQLRSNTHTACCVAQHNNLPYNSNVVYFIRLPMNV